MKTKDLVMCALLAAVICILSPVSVPVGTVVLYVIGTVWFIKVYGCGLSDAMAWCVTPFIAGDLLKMVVVALVAPQVRKALVRAGILTVAGAAA